ncbi:MAG: Hsp20/alpha crystallin family protein [Gallionella sp.]
MKLVKWDPFRELEDVSARLNRIFGQPFVRSGAGSGAGNEMLAVADWAPSVDISETDSAYLIKGEIPGVQKENVKVTIEDGMLTIQGERKQEKEEKGKKCHRVECSYGKFMRSFQVPDDADENNVKAEFKDGMLNVTLGKSAKAQDKAKAINVAVT